MQILLAQHGRGGSCRDADLMAMFLDHIASHSSAAPPRCLLRACMSHGVPITVRLLRTCSGLLSKLLPLNDSPA